MTHFLFCCISDAHLIGSQARLLTIDLKLWGQVWCLESRPQENENSIHLKLSIGRASVFRPLGDENSIQ